MHRPTPVFNYDDIDNNIFESDKNMSDLNDDYSNDDIEQNMCEV